MKPLHSVKAIKPLGAFLVCLVATIAAATATADTLYFEGGTFFNYNTEVKAGDTIVMKADLALGEGLFFGATGQPLKSFSIISDDPNTWRTFTHDGGTGGRLMQLQNGAIELTFDHIIFSSGTAPATPGGGFNFSGGTTNQTLTINGDFIVQDCYIGTNGGGMWIASQAVFTGSVSFLRNRAMTTGVANGGAIATNNADGLTFRGISLFASNTSVYQGGAISQIKDSLPRYGVIFENKTTFTDNYAGVRGGAISAHSVDIQKDADFINNRAGTEGGALYARSTSSSVNSVRIAPVSGAVVFSNNAAINGSGGAIYAQGAMSVSGSTSFAGNSAGASGGAIYAQGNLSVSGFTSFVNNSAGAFGGAIYFRSANGTHTLTLNASESDILFENNQDHTSSTPGRNAISIYTDAAQTSAPSLVLNTGNAAAAHVIRFHDPISVSDVTALARITQTGNGIVLYDTWQSAVSATTTLSSGTMLLTRGAVYGTSDSIGDFIVSGSATLSGNGAVRAATITLADGAHIQVNGNGTLSLQAATFATGTDLKLSGHGVIAAATTLNVSLIEVGSPFTDNPLSLTGANFAQTLTLGSSTPVVLADGGSIEIDLFGSAGDLLVADSFTLSGSAYVNLTGIGNGAYKVLVSSGNLATNTADLIALVNGSAPAGHYEAAKDYRNSNTELWINLITKNLVTTWTGTALEGGIWKHSPDDAFSWTDGDATQPDLSFLNGDAVVFDDSATVRTVAVDAAGVITANMTVSNASGNDYTITGAGGIVGSATNSSGGVVVSPDGKLVKTGAGALTFENTGANTFEGGIEIGGGTLGFTAASQLGDGGNGIRFTDAAVLLARTNNITLANTLKIDAGKTATLDIGANTLAHAGAIVSTGTLAKIGSGMLRLTADNATGAGDTHVMQGSLILDGASAKLGGRIDVDAGAILGGSGVATGDVHAATGAIIRPGIPAAADPVTLTINNLHLDSSILRFNLFTTGTNDRINVTGMLTLAGNNTVDISAFRTGTFNLGRIAGLNVAGTEITISGVAQIPGSRQTGVLSSSGGDLLLIAGADMSRILRWTGVTSGTWISIDSNWTDGAAVSLYSGGDRVIFDDSAAGVLRDITIAGSGVTVSDMHVQGTSSYAFTGAGITADPTSVVSGTVITTGAGKLVKAGGGTLAFTNAANIFQGGIEIDGGAITFTGAGQLGDGGNGISFTGDAALASLSDGQTLANDIAISAGKTATLDTGANTLILTGSLTASGGAATLAKTGAGMLVLSGMETGGANLLARIDEGSIGLDDIRLAGAIELGANTTLIGTGAVGAVRADGNATVRIDAGTLHVDDMRLAAGATLAGSGILGGAAVLDGQVIADIAAGGTLTLASSITGAGGFLKTGNGYLNFDGAAALQNTGTMQIDQGVVIFAGISATDASLVSQNIMLNGGILSLNSDSAGTSESAAANWSGLHLIQGANAADSWVTGANEMLTVGSGTMSWGMRGGIHVIVDAGNGVTVLGNANNTFDGIVRVDSGTLRVDSIGQLGATGTLASAKVALTGGALQISGTGITTTRAIELRADGAVTVDSGIETTWGAITKPVSTDAATFTKAGSGTLAVMGANAATGMTVAGGVYIARSAAASPATTVAVNSGAAFVLSPTNAPSGAVIGSTGGRDIIATGTVASDFTGSGTLIVSNGTPLLTGGLTDIAHINVTGNDVTAIVMPNQRQAFFGHHSAITVDRGSLVLGAANQTMGDVTLANGGTLGFLMNAGTVQEAFKTATLSSLAGNGALVFNANLARGSADMLTVNSAITGTYGIHVGRVGDAPREYHAAITLINAPDSGDVTFNTPGAIDVGLYSYAVSATTAGGKTGITISGTGAMSNSASLVNAMSGALPLSWFAELNTVAQRMGELHMETRDREGGPGTWVRGYGQSLEFKDNVTGTPFDERLMAVEAGVDYKIPDVRHNVYLGAFFGYGQTDRAFSMAGEGGTESFFGGVYGTLGAASGWYVDGILKLNGFKNTFTAISPTGESMTANYDTWAQGASLEIGKYCQLKRGWYFEPQIQGAFTTMMKKEYVTSSGMNVEVCAGTTAQGRVGFMFGRIIKTGAEGLLHVYVKGYGARQWTTDGQIIVTLRNGQSERYSPKIEGDRIEGGGGIAWRATRRMQYYFDFETASADCYVKPWGVNFGIRRNW
ncbi:MAG: autotransporter outer membrane beta-barrel domain-containing protein [Opitutaceae bacterium]|jgi:outer membrane autotransporter protein|nr:autotransporter outer membrane beta-barrel domain-containing protein [Opitutaceae bacterium]